jgi:hypothetical protein
LRQWEIFFPDFNRFSGETTNRAVIRVAHDCEKSTDLSDEIMRKHNKIENGSIQSEAIRF